MEESRWRSLLLSVWEIWERLFGKLHHIQNIRPGGMFRLNTCCYHGPNVELNDGTLIRSGDPLGELHLSNRATLRLQIKYSSRVKAAIAAKKELTQDLIVLAGRATTDQDMAGIKAFYAITTLYHGARVLGFEDQEFKESSIMRWVYTMGESFLLALYHPAGIARFWQGHQDRTAKYIWMSRQKLLHDFLPAQQGNSQ